MKKKPKPGLVYALKRLKEQVESLSMSEVISEERSKRLCILCAKIDMALALGTPKSKRENVLAEVIDEFTPHVKYAFFDSEARLRENEQLRKMLENEN